VSGAPPVDLEAAHAPEAHVPTAQLGVVLDRLDMLLGRDRALEVVADQRVGRDAATIYFDLHQRTLRYELYFMPSPPANHLALYEWLLKRNHTMYGARFSLGPDGDVYLTGRTALEHLTTEELDRVIGVLYELTEQWFQPAIRLGFGAR
jgi:hypothetical protein